MAKEKFPVIIVLCFTILLCCACVRDYREDLEKKGIPFTVEAFLKKVEEGDKEHVKLFLKARMDVNAKDNDGSSALMIASEKADPAMARLLLENGADVNAHNVDGHTALMFAAYKGNSLIAELLIKNKADVHARDKDGWTALRYASVQGRNDIVTLLKEARDKN